MPRPPSQLITAAAVAGCFAVPLLLPDVLPDSWRGTLVTAGAFMALAVTVVLLLIVRSPVTPSLLCFGCATAVSWGLMPAHDLVGIRHLGGIAFGLLAMGLVARVSTGQQLSVAATAIAAGAGLVLLVGIAGTQVYPYKFMGGIVSVPEAIYFWMPRLKLGLPGLSDTGYVNPNALGGTALLLLPLCAGIAVAGRRAGHRLPQLFGALGTMAGLVALLVTLSRTAMLATVLTAALFAVWHRRTRRIAALAIGLLIVVGAVLVAHSRATSPAKHDAGLTVMFASLQTRTAIWSDGTTELARRPLFGVGLNQFHVVTPRLENEGASYVAHAHNIFLQTALDIGLVGLAAYVWLFGTVIRMAVRAANSTSAVSSLAAGAALSIVGVHLFGLTDAIALGAKVGLFQWLSAGLILGAAQIAAQEERPVTTTLETIPG